MAACCPKNAALATAGPGPILVAAVISRLRQAIAVAVATLVTVLTLGRVRVDWTGRLATPDDADDPGRPAATRQVGPGRPRTP